MKEWLNIGLQLVHFFAPCPNCGREKVLQHLDTHKPGDGNSPQFLAKCEGCEFEFIQVLYKPKAEIMVPLEDIGFSSEITAGEEEAHLVFLKDAFILEHARFGSRVPIQYEEERDTGVICPFCEKGHLVLDGLVEPSYSGGAASVPSTLHHVGDSFRLKCSNPEGCKSYFTGSVRWAWID